MALTKTRKAAASIEEDPPSASSETIESGDSETDSGEESEEIPTPTTQTEKHEEGPSNEEEESDEDEESDHELVKLKPVAIDIKPISSKPMDTEPVEPTKKSNRTVKPSKRALEAEKSEQATKRKKKKVEDKNLEAEPEKKNDKPSIVRMWNEDDENVILDGLLSLAKKGMNPNKLNPDLVVDEIKGKLSSDVDKAKLMKKIAKIKFKYNTHFKKEKEGKDVKFLKPRDEQNFEISKKLWSSDGVNGNGDNVMNSDGASVQSGKPDQMKKVKLANNGVVSLSPKKKPVVKFVEAPVEPIVPGPNIESVDGTNSWSDYPSIMALLANPEEFSKVPSFEMDLRLKVIGHTQKVKAEELERKWKDLRALELKIYLTRLQLTQDTLRFLSGLNDA